MLGSFAALIDLTVGDGDVFVGPVSPDRGSRIYGGQLLAQSLRAAQLTVPENRYVHSAHSHFLKAGNAAEPVEMEVERIREGRSFSQRQVVASQSGSEIFRNLTSFHVREEGLDWQEPTKINIAQPTSNQPYTDYSDYLESLIPLRQKPWSGRQRPIEVRYINPPTRTDNQPVTEPQLMWMRVQGQLEAEDSLHEVGLAYLADLGMDANAVLPHGHRWGDDQLTVASLDHSIWFHRPARVDTWLFSNQRVEVTRGGRGMASGRFYDTSGQLLATCMQEGLMRWSQQQ
tara:strand:+ start:164 stop:1024 length:861 start_codon:yes stop_codon:yes gene_type:complete